MFSNKVFFKYFDQYTTVEEFKQKHQCLCDYFVEEEGYIHKDMNGVNWIDYLIQNPDKYTNLMQSLDKGKLYLQNHLRNYSKDED